MAEPHYLKRNDTRPVLFMNLKRNGQPIDLTGAASARMLLQLGSTTTSKALSFGTRTAGEVWGVFSSAESAQVGTYKVEVEITWSAGAIETIPNKGTETLIIEPDLG